MGYKLLRQGVSRAQVAKRLDVPWVTANRWMKWLKSRGERSWHDRGRSGGPQKLTGAQKRKLKRMLAKGALEYGYTTKLWTLKRVTEVIEEEFHVMYNVTHVWRVLRSLGLTAQVPLLRAMEREMAITTGGGPRNSSWLRRRTPSSSSRPRAQPRASPTSSARGLRRGQGLR